MPVPITVATCTEGDEELMCKDTSIDVNLVNHTRCQCGCNINLRSCKGKQVSESHIRFRIKSELDL